MGDTIPPPAFEPGERYRYSPAAKVAGILIEVISGMTLESFFKKNILDPLSMDDTSFSVPKEKRGRFVNGYMRSETGNMTAVCLEQDDGSVGLDDLKKCPMATPSGRPSGDQGLRSTPLDWHKFTAMLVSGGRYGPRLEHQLLTSEAFGIMIAVATPPLDDQHGFCTHHTDVEGSGLLFFSNQALGGFAQNLIGEVAISDNNCQRVSSGTFGWEGILTTKYAVDRKEGLAIAFFSQVAPCWRYNLGTDFLPLVYESILPNSRSKL